MPTGQKIKLEVPVSDTSLEVVRDDPRLVPGTLLLADPGHSLEPWAVGVPAQAAKLPNLALDFAEDAFTAAAVGHNADDLRLSFGRSASFVDDSKGRIERTGKGGLHVMCRQSSATLISNDYAGLSISGPFSTYLVNKKAQAQGIYYSMWVRKTRAMPNTPGGLTLAEFGGASTLDAAKLMFLWEDFGDGGGTDVPNNDQFTLNNVRLDAQAFRNPENSVAAGGTLPSRFVAEWGFPGSTYNSAVAPSRGNLAPSFIFYSTWICDLAVAGLTFAEAFALDKQAFQKSFETGGRYADDTFTAPSAFGA